MPKKNSGACVVPKTQSIKRKVNGKEVNSSFKAKSTRPKSKTDAKKDAAAAKKQGKLARVIEVCGGHVAYIGPNAKKKKAAPKRKKTTARRKKR